MRLHGFLFLAAALLCAGEAGAEPPGRRGGDWRNPPLGSNWSPDAAREAVREGRHRPLREVVRGLRRQMPGDIVDVIGLEERREGGAIYRIRWRTPEGRIMDLNVDAETGAVLR